MSNSENSTTAPVPPVQDQTDFTLRSQSFSEKSEESQTAADFITSQLQLEADAREALPYSIDQCTQPLGSLRQIIFACLTCNPPPSDSSDEYTPAGVCYACSVQCHGEHTLVELFNKRNFTCDCGTTRLPATSPCALRLNPETNTKGEVHSQPAVLNNKYNQNFRNKFCGCENDYDPFLQKGTMFQCLGLGTTEDGGCGEDWYHPACVTGHGFKWHETAVRKEPSTMKPEVPAENTGTGTGTNERPNTGPEAEEEEEDGEEDPPLPPGFPEEDDFEGFICYKCVDANPWIKQYAGTEGFLEPVFRRSKAPSPESKSGTDSFQPNLKKRKADDDLPEEMEVSKRVKEEGEEAPELNTQQPSLTEAPLTVEIPESCKTLKLPPTSTAQFSIFFKADFRDYLCHCSACFKNLAKHPQLLEEEETYEPPMSEPSNDGASIQGHSTLGSGSIYDRGESALRNVDRVRAIEGAMAYNHLKEQLQPFFRQFAESGQAISAEDIKAHFKKMRGDADGTEDENAAQDDSLGGNRKEQHGY